ncbi:MAG: PQQ-dependent sugar dehydrogenase [Fimbriimonadaceae bacterium]|nr:MAG: PQQ-dependent sugar dehydrogenase [Fimbriimonadaceae bacterium]
MKVQTVCGSLAALSLVAIGAIACTGAAQAKDEGSVVANVAEQVPSQKVTTQGPPPEETGWKEEVVVSGLDTPWGMTWLPDGRLIFTEKAGRITIFDPKSGEKVNVTGLPEVLVNGQGGLMDISLHPKFKENGYVYMTVAQGTARENHTVLARGKLVGDKLEGTTVLFRPNFKKQGGQHFGSRILWLPDGTLLFSLGDGGNPPSAINGKLTRHYVQDMDSHLGKLLRLDENGKAPKDNPFVNQSGALPEIFSVGHRNIQGLAYDPNLKMIWANEHGANGGDEVNQIQKGKNYGWPLATFSREYSGPIITENTSLPGYEDPKVAWTPCPAPCGLAYYNGNKYPQFKGDLFSGGLAGQDIRRLDLDSKGNVTRLTRFNIKSRVRNVAVGPDGYIYFATDERGARISRIILD